MDGLCDKGTKDDKAKTLIQWMPIQLLRIRNPVYALATSY